MTWGGVGLSVKPARLRVFAWSWCLDEHDSIIFSFRKCWNEIIVNTGITGEALWLISLLS